MKEAKDEGEPNFYIGLSELMSLLHAGGLPLPGKTGFLLGSSVDSWNKALLSGPSPGPM